MRPTENRLSKFDDGFEVIDEEDLASCSQDAQPHPRPSIMARSSWSTFLRRPDTPASTLVKNHYPAASSDRAHTSEERETSMSAQIESQSVVSRAGDHVESNTNESTGNKYHATNKDLSAKLDALNNRVNRMSKVSNHLQTCQQAYDRDIRNLQDQVAQCKLPVERSDKLYDLVKAQIHSAAVGIERRIKTDLMVALENQIAKYRVPYEDEIAELRHLQQQQGWEIRRLRQELNYLDDVPSRPVTMGA